MRIARKVFPTIFVLIGMLLCSEATKAAQHHVFFIPPGGGLNEVTGGNGSWQSPTTFFTGVGFVTPQNSTVASFTAGGLLYVAFFCNSAVCAMYSSDNVNWTLTNISGASNAPPPDVNSGLIGYADYKGNPRIFYVAISPSQSHEVFEIYRSGGWNGDGGASIGTVAANGTPLVGYLYSHNNVTTANVFYVATDGHIHETDQSSSTGAWSTTDVTADSGAPSPVSGSALLGYPWNSNAPIVFIASDQHMHQAWWNGTTWNTNDITAQCSCTLPEFGTPLMGYFWSGEPINDYVGIDQHVHQVWWNGSQMLTNDWTAGAGGQPFTTTPLTGNNGTGVFYLDTSSQLREYWYNGTNHDTELMPFTGTPSGSGLAIAVF
jgi:hypothetical protein